MVKYAPSYYGKFKCIADRCRHNCCIGWDVEIDKESYSVYQSMGGPLGEKILNCISFDNENPYFIMKDNGKCPFLNESGLCDIISAAGDDVIPYICRMHPRFKNVFSGREEIGLGICCEEAARIIVNEKNPFSLEFIGGEEESLTDFEKYLIGKRAELFDIFNRKGVNISEKISVAAKLFSIDEEICINKSAYAVFEQFEYMSRELPDAISQMLADERSFSEYGVLPEELERGLSNIACYLIFRMLSPAENETEMRARFGAFLLSLDCISKIAIQLFRSEGCVTLEDLAELSRLYSAEIEYSPENTEILISEFDFLLNC